MSVLGGMFKDRVSQIDAMRLGVDMRMSITLKGFTMAIRPLAISETMKVTASVIAQMGLLPEAERNALTENTLIAKETLKLASTSDFGVDDPKITDYILDRMTHDEINYIWKQYVAACDKVSPDFEKLSPDKVQALVDEVKKSPEAATRLSFWELVGMAQHFCSAQE